MVLSGATAVAGWVREDVTPHSLNHLEARGIELARRWKEGDSNSQEGATMLLSLFRRDRREIELRSQRGEETMSVVDIQRAESESK